MGRKEERGGSQCRAVHRYLPTGNGLKEGQCFGKGVGRISQTEEANYYVTSYAFGG